MNRKGLALVVAIIMVATLVMPAFAAGMPFADVPKDHWAYDSVAELAASGLIIGYPDGTFKGERQFTRYEMAMVFARVLGRLDTLIAAEVGAEVEGMSDDIYNKVAQALVEEMAKVKADLTATIEAELAGVELPEAKVVERVVVEKPVEVVQPFELTDEAKAVIAKVAADAVAENVSKLEPQVVEKLVEIEPELTARDLQGLLAAVANAQTTADLNAEDIAELQEDVAKARKLIDEVAFGLEVNDAILAVADKKADMALAEADEAKSGAAEAKALATTATEQALAALKGAEDAGAAAAAAAEKADAAAAAAEAATQEVRSLAITVAALEGDVDALAALLESTTKAMESEIAALSEEFGAELASLGVRVADLENIVEDNTARIDLLEWQVAKLDDEMGTTATDISDLRAADQVLEEDLSALEDEHAETAAKLTVVDEEQKTTAADFVTFKEEHEKVKLSGSTETVFKNVGIDIDDQYLVGDKEVEKRKGVYKDPRDEDDDEIYERTAKLEQKFELNLEATPAEGVSVKAGLASTADIFGDIDDDGELGLEDVKLEVNTDKALRWFFAGQRTRPDVAARYNEFIIHDDEDLDDMEAVAANVVLGNLDTEVQLFRPWNPNTEPDEGKEEAHKAENPEELQYKLANYGALVNTAYKLSDAFVIDLQYGRMWFDEDANTGMEAPIQDWAYSLGLNGKLNFADYEVAYAANNAEKSGYKIVVGKKYGPEPEEGEDDTRPQWKVTYKAVDDGYTKFLTAKSIDDYTSNLKLTADNFDLLGLTLGGAYVTKDGNATKDKTDVTAMKFTAEKKDLFGIPLTVGAEYANIENAAVKDGSSLLGRVAYEPTFGKLGLAASYEYTTNAIDSDFDAPSDWVETKSKTTEPDEVAWGEAVPEQTLKLSAEYPVEIWDTTITGFVGYENRTSDMDRHGREYEDPLMTYRISADRDFGTANLYASYQYRTGGPNNLQKTKYDEDEGAWGGSDPEIDKIAEVKLTYPVIDDVADLELGYRHVDVEAYDRAFDYTATELNAGLKFEF